MTQGKRFEKLGRRYVDEIFDDIFSSRPFRTRIIGISEAMKHFIMMTF